MRRGKQILALLLVILGTAAAGIWGFEQYQAQFVTIGQVRYKKDTELLNFSGGQVPEVEILRQLPDLKWLDLRGTDLTAGEYEALRGAFPRCRILWDIPFQGKRYPENTKKLTVNTLTQADLDTLAYFEELTTINAQGCTDYDCILRLRESRPDLQIFYWVTLGGEDYFWDTKAITLPGSEIESLERMLPYLPEMERVELAAPLPAWEALAALQEAYPELELYWELKFLDIPVNSNTESLDLIGKTVTLEEIEAVIPYLPSLRYVDMSGCGISNEEMDALNRRHEDIRIVWTVDLGWGRRVRTDITWYMPIKEGFKPAGNRLANLRYCTEVIALDVGHMKVTNCDYVAYMPHLKYLLLGDTLIRDLTPLTGLKELVYLELFLGANKDFTPLLTLTALEDLNICYTRGDPEIIAQMTWLKNLWWCDLPELAISPEKEQLLRDSIPGCRFYFGNDSSTGGGWRELPNYYAQRDVFGMPYYTG